MIIIKGLIWDDWNKEHIAKHGISLEEVEEVCHNTYEVVESYRKRIQLCGNTKKGRKLVIILSPEDRELNILNIYGNGIYYPITVFEVGEEVK